MQSLVRPSRHHALACGRSLVLQSFRIFPGRADGPARGTPGRSGFWSRAIPGLFSGYWSKVSAAARRAARRWLRPCPAAFFSATLWSVSVHADNWPAWRGAEGLGIAREKNLPLQWSATENVRWTIAMPDRGNSSPIVWRNRVFITQALEKEQRLTVMCFDRAEGKLLWQAGTSSAAKDPTHRTNPYCSSSPVTDGERVIAWFGSAGLF